MKTKNCVSCYEKEATFWFGFVVMNGKTIPAGWCCYDHYFKHIPVIHKNDGHMGDWNPIYGLIGGDK